MTNQIEALTAAAKKYSKTLNTHRANPKDMEAVEAWDKATSEFDALIKNNELDIVASLIAALEQSQQQIISLFERVSGEPVTNYPKDSVEWLADIIEGELDASEGALVNAKKRIAELEASQSQSIPALYLCRVFRDGEELYSPCGKDYPRGRAYYTATSKLAVKLPAACADDEYFIDGVFQPLRYERDVIRALASAGITVQGDE